MTAFTSTSRPSHRDRVNNQEVRQLLNRLLDIVRLDQNLDVVVLVCQQGQETFLNHVFELDLFRDHLFWLHSARADCLENFVEISENIRSYALPTSQSKQRHVHEVAPTL